jgi:hypothetical protein
MVSKKPLTLYFLNGETMSVDHKDVVSILTDPFAVFIMLFSANIIRAMNALVLDLPLELLETIILSVGLAAVLWETLLTIGVILTWLGERAGRTIVAPVPLITFVAILLNDVVILWIYSRVLDMDVWNFATVSEIFLLNYVIHLGFEFFFSAIVVPKLKRSSGEDMIYETVMRSAARGAAGFREEAATPPRLDSHQLLVAGEAIAAHEVKLVEADEHYVFVHFSDVKLHVRERFGSLVGMLKTSQGIQVHKSYWVAFTHIREVQPKRDGSLILVLEDSTTIPVARGRASTFRNRYQHWKTLREVGRYSLPVEN